MQSVESTLYCVCNSLWSKMSAVKNKWPSDYNFHSAIAGVPSPCLYSLLCYFTVYDFPRKLVKMWCCVAQWVQAPPLSLKPSLCFSILARCHYLSTQGLFVTYAKTHGTEPHFLTIRLRQQRVYESDWSQPEIGSPERGSTVAVISS